MQAMKSVLVRQPLPPELEALIQRRRALGQDRFDEVWEGVYHMTPAPSGPHAVLLHRLDVLLDPNATAAGLIGATGFNLGSDPTDYRVPDSGYLREMPTGVWIASAVIVVEILSPGDDTYEKFAFYARHGVEEILVIDPGKHSVEMWKRADDVFSNTDSSSLLKVGAAELGVTIDWPE